jgi:hypothetical protein
MDDNRETSHFETTSLIMYESIHRLQPTMYTVGVIRGTALLCSITLSTWPVPDSTVPGEGEAVGRGGMKFAVSMSYEV